MNQNAKTWTNIGHDVIHGYVAFLAWYVILLICVFWFVLNVSCFVSLCPTNLKLYPENNNSITFNLFQIKALTTHMPAIDK